MKLLHVIPGLGVRQGGLQSALLNLCRAQSRVGLEPVIAALIEPESVDRGFDEFRTHFFPSRLRTLGTSAEMRRWLAAHAREFDAVVAHSLWRAPLFYAARATDPSRFLVMAHGMLDPEAAGHRRWRKLLRWREVKDAIARATVVFTCEGEARIARECGPLGVGRESVVIPLAVEVPQAPPAYDASGPVVALGRIHPRKGVLEWVRSLTELERGGVPFHAVHAGPVEDPAYDRRVREEARALILAGRLEFRGAIAYREAQALLLRAGLVTAPAAVRENFGMVIAEGMAAARPVVAGRRALLVGELEQIGAVRGAELEPVAFAAAMRELLLAPAERAALGRRAHAAARERYSFEAVGMAWRELVARSVAAGR